MPDVNIFFFDLPAGNRLPGLPGTLPVSFFPFAGMMRLIDISISTFSEDIERNLSILCEDRNFRQFTDLADVLGLSPDRLFSLDGSLPDLSAYLKSLPEGWCILHNTSHAYGIEHSIEDIIDHLDSSALHRLVVDHMPVDTYITTRKNLLQILAKTDPDMEGLPVKDTFFHKVLPESADSMEDIPGTLYFTRNLFHYYDWHIRTADTDLSPLTDIIHPLSIRVSGETVVTSKGEVTGSFIGSGCHIGGNVSNSFLFPGVYVPEGCKVKDSVILSDNILGRESEIDNALIMPGSGESGSHREFGNGAVIGRSNSKVTNRRYPDQIYDGLTVIGSSARIPNRVIIEPGCFIDTDLSGKMRKKGNRISRGTSIPDEKEYAG